MPKKQAENLIGRTFGRLTVRSKGQRGAQGHVRWVCSCDCGRETLTRTGRLLRGVTLDCGCANPRNFQHGESKRRRVTREYEAWNQARWRCENPKHRAYADYGGRGIQVKCTFDEMLTAIGRCPPGLTLDRIDNNGHYEVGNIRWATRRVQRLNRRGPQFFTLDNEPISLREMAHAVAMGRNQFREGIWRSLVPIVP